MTKQCGGKPLAAALLPNMVLVLIKGLVACVGNGKKSCFFFRNKIDLN